MNVLVVDAFPEAGREQLARLGMKVTYEPTAGADKLAALLPGHDVLVVRSTKVSADALKAGKELQLVVRAGAGVNTIDVATASSLGIFVANCPGKNAIAVAELAIGMLLALDRRLHRAHAELQAGRWNKKEFSKADGVFGKTLGVVGVGDIGRAVISRAKALGMHVVAWSRSLTDEAARELGVERLTDLSQLAQRSHAVSVHLALHADTKGLISRAFIAHLPKNALLINTSRDGIVDEAAVLEAMESRGLRYAADVFDKEPAEGTAAFATAIATHAGSLCTPHIGASTEQAQSAVADETVRIIDAFAHTGVVPNCVNLCKQSPAQWQLTVRHLDKVGVLASVLGQLREAGINVEEVENIIFDGAKAACARIRLGSEPNDHVVSAVRKQEHVLGAQLVTLR